MALWRLFFYAAAFALIVGAVFQARLSHSSSAAWSPWRAGVGLAITLAAIGTGGPLVGFRTEAPREQLGVGIVVHGVDGSAERGFDMGLFVATHVVFHGCGRAVDVTLTLQPTAEFWVDNRRVLKDEGRIDFGVPDEHLTNVRALLGEEETVPLPSSQGQAAKQLELEEVDVSVANGVTKASVVVPRWGRSPQPVSLAFSADWAKTQSQLGACTLELPALTGPPTVLTSARMERVAASLKHEIPTSETYPASLFVVSSSEWHAYYNPDYEITRGITTLDTDNHSVDAGRSLPGPTTTTDGAPAWDCSSSIIKDVGILATTPPHSPVGDFMVSGVANQGAFGAERIDATLAQRSCATSVALVDPSYGPRRDLLLIVIGALFSLGIELLLNALSRRRRISAVGTAA